MISTQALTVLVAGPSSFIRPSPFHACGSS
jgi:hypothetical protein